jgi:murein L,D-transpeptidase YcbB/YkuD
MQLARYDMLSIFTGWKRICASGVIIFTLAGTNIAIGASTVAPATPSEILRAADASETEAERAELHAIYQGLGGALIWTTTPRRVAFIKLLASLESDGIGIQQLGPLPGDKIESQVRADVSATRVILRAAHLVSAGSTAPANIPGWSLVTEDTPVVEMIVGAAQRDRLGALFDDLRPTGVAYRQLRAVYLRYLRLATETWNPLEASVEVHLDTDDSRIAELRRRLVLLGDSTETELTGDALLDAIKRFQRRHGLAVDGRIGPATLAALNVSPAVRAQQIAVNLEYWRLLPRIWPKRYVAVNAAAAHLELVNEGRPSYASRVIVGDPRHPTPVMAASITGVTFNPSWTVPHSIAVKEMLPRLHRDATYLERSNIKIVGRDFDPHGLQLDWRAYSQRRFPFQLRQVPGPTNALGLLKFEMPNGFDVYLHDTPDKSLFEKASRTLSHGCVRVDCASDLAKRLIEDPAVWLEGGLSAALADGRTMTVPLSQPLPVYLLYFTAYEDESGLVNFRPDVYGRDQVVRRSLRTPLARDLGAAHIAEGS